MSGTNYSDYEKVKLKEIADIERAVKGKIYKAGSTIIQVSATSGDSRNIGILKKGQKVDCKYAVITPMKVDPEYLHIAIERRFKNFMETHKTGMNLQIGELYEMDVLIHNDAQTRQKVVDFARKIDREIELVYKTINTEKELKKAFLTDMFPR